MNLRGRVEERWPSTGCSKVFFSQLKQELVELVAAWTVQAKHPFPKARMEY